MGFPGISYLTLRTVFIMYSVLGAVSVNTFKLSIIHTNDVHARFEQTSVFGSECSDSDIQDGKCFDGVARRATKIKQLREEMNNTILLDAGDQFQGTMWYTHYKGEAAAYFMNKLQYEAMALGNHEFDDGIDVLASFVNNLTFPVLSSNLDVSEEPRLRDRVTKSTVLEVSGQNIGIVGYTTSRTPLISNPGKTVSFDDVKAAVQGEVEALTAKGVNKIIALGHAGLPMDMMLAKEVPNIDLVVGGHTHTFLYTGPKPSIEKPEGPYPTVVTNTDGDRVPVVTAYCFGKYLGHINLDFDADGKVVSWQGTPILLDNSTAQDPEILTDVERFVQPINVFKNQTVGSSRVFLEGDTNFCRVSECNMGNLFADALVWFYLPETLLGDGWADVSFALINGGGIRAPIDKGTISMAEVTTTFPFGNTVDIISMRGEHLLKVFEHSVSLYSFEDRFGGFLQMSGVHVQYDLSQPVGSRVVSVMVLCAKCDIPDYFPLNKTEVYRFVTINFIIDGGDGYDVIKDNVISKDERDDLDITVMTKYIEKFSPIVAATERRIQFVDKNAECGTSSANRSATAPLSFILMILWHLVRLTI